jgi:two-component system, chemotaxis family, CheB/CheR fusion protein
MKSDRQQETTSIDSEELKILIDNIQDYAIFKVNETGVIITWNEGVKRILQYDQEEFIGEHFSLVFTEEDNRSRMADKELTKAKTFGTAQDERWHVKKDGSLFRATGVLTRLYDSEGNPRGYAKIMRDITDEIDAERRIQQSEERYRSFIQNTSEGIWRFELDQPIDTRLSEEEQIEQIYKYAYLAECNDAMAKMYGYASAADITGARIGNFLVADNPVNREYLKAFIRSGYRLANAESKEIDRNGEEKYFSNNLIGVIEDNLVVRAWGSQRDTTSEYLVMKQKDEFVGVVSHELKTPLTSIKAYVQILAKKFSSTPEASQYISKVNSQIIKLTNLINELLDSTKMESNQLELHKQSVNIDQLVTNIIEDLQSASDHHTIVKEGSITGEIVNDKDRVEQILINLITNAIKYSPNADKVIVRLDETEKFCQIAVQDFGIGISKRDQSKVFKKYYRAGGVKNKTFPGLGLGLYISAELAKNLDGSLTLQSEKGIGSTFYLKLPK